MTDADTLAEIKAKRLPPEGLKLAVSKDDVEWLLARVETLSGQVDVLEGREASLVALVNSWARESGVTQAERPENSKECVDRLWAHWTMRCSGLLAHIEALEQGRAPLLDCINTCLREASVHRQLGITDDPREGVNELLYALNRVQAGRDALRAALTLSDEEAWQRAIGLIPPQLLYQEFTELVRKALIAFLADLLRRAGTFDFVLSDPIRRLQGGSQ